MFCYERNEQNQKVSTYFVAQRYMICADLSWKDVNKPGENEAQEF